MTVLREFLQIWSKQQLGSEEKRLNFNSQWIHVVIMTTLLHRPIVQIFCAVLQG